MDTIIKTPYLKSRVHGFQLSIATPTVTVDFGNQDLSATASASAGLGTLTYLEPYARASIGLASVGANVADGGYPTLQLAGSTTTGSVEWHDASGSGDDGTGDVLFLGWDSDVEDVVLEQEFWMSQREPRWEVFSVASNALTRGAGRASVSVASSVYTFTLEESYGNSNILVFPKIIGATAGTASVTSKAAGTFAVSTFDSSGTPTDQDFDVLVCGFDANDEVGGPAIRREINATHRRPMFFPLRILDTAGTPSITIGGELFSIVDGGTGDYEITYTPPADQWETQRALFAFPTAVANNAQIEATPTSTTFTVRVFDDGGSGADDSVDVWVLGFNDDGEY